jgi:hypothetical protein
VCSSDLKPVGTTGNIGAFANQPLVFQERAFDSYRRVFVANGHKGTVTVTYGLTNLNNNITVSTNKTTLTANGTTEFTFYDPNSNFPEGSLHSGTLDLIAKSSANTALGVNSVPLRVISTEYTNKPALEVRFVDPRPGTTVGGEVQSIAYVRNTATTAALGCRFDTYGYTYNSFVSTHSREVLADGFGPMDPIFTIKPNSTRQFLVSGRVSANDSYRYTKLYCANYYGSINTNDSARLEPTTYYGIYPNLKVNPKTDNVFGEVKIPDFGSKKVYVTMTNVGQYSGYFSIQAYGDTYQDKAVIMAMCVVNDNNVCIGPSSTSSVTFDMAQGETRRIAVTIRRGNSTPG